jgi:DNA replication protein DnaC
VLARRLHVAKLRGNACVEDIDFRAARGLDKSAIRALAQESAWVRNHEHVFVLGPTGVGNRHPSPYTSAECLLSRCLFLYDRGNWRT